MHPSRSSLSALVAVAAALTSVHCAAPADDSQGTQASGLAEPALSDGSGDGEGLRIIGITSRGGQGLNMMFAGAVPEAWIELAGEDDISEDRFASILALAEQSGTLVADGNGDSDGVSNTAGACTAVIAGDVIRNNAQAGGHIGERHVQGWPGGIIHGPSGNVANMDASLIARAGGQTSAPAADPSSAWYSSADGTKAIKQVYKGKCGEINSFLTSFANGVPARPVTKGFTYPTSSLGRSCSRAGSCTNAKSAQLYIRPAIVTTRGNIQVVVGSIETAYPYASSY